MNKNYEKLYNDIYEKLMIDRKEINQLSNKIKDLNSEKSERLIGELKANVILSEGVKEPKETLDPIHKNFKRVKDYINSQKESPRAYGAINQLESFKEKYDNEVSILVEKEPSVVRDNIARKLNFLVNKDGENVYEEIKDTKLKATGIALINKAKTFNHYAVSLTNDNDQKEYYVNVHTDKNMNTIRSDWKQPKTGSEWLCEDMKAHYMENNPDRKLVGQDKPNYEDLDFKPVELTQNKSPKM